MIWDKGYPTHNKIFLLKTNGLKRKKRMEEQEKGEERKEGREETEPTGQ